MPIPPPSGFKAIVALLVAVCMLVAPQALAQIDDLGAPPPAENEELNEERALAEEFAPSDIENIVVPGTRQSRYRVGASDALTGFSLDALELPRVIEVIPEQLLIDQQVTELEGALRNVPGVSFGDGFGGTNDDYFIRGFRRNVVYRDGFRRASNIKTSTTNLEQIRVIKGPASIAYGQVEPGGLVDLVTKKANGESRNYVQLRGGSFQDFFTLADISQPITDTVALRINASFRDADNFRSFSDVQVGVASISGLWAVTDTTRLQASYEYRDESRSHDRGTITVPTAPGKREIVNGPLDIPRTRRFGEPWETFDTKFQFLEMELEQEFLETWSFRIAGAYESSKSSNRQARPLREQIYGPNAPVADGYTRGATPKPFLESDADQVLLIRRADGAGYSRTQASYVNAVLSGTANTWGVEHTLAFGGSYRRGRTDNDLRGSAATDGIPIDEGGTGPLFNIREPVYERLPPGRTAFSVDFEFDSLDYGVYLNDYIRLTDSLALLVGVRVDFVDIDGAGEANTIHDVSPQVAINYRPLEWISVFASYAEAFVPNEAFSLDADLNPTLDPFAPENSRQYEIGSKAQFFEEALNATLALYRIEKTNVLTTVDDVAQLVDGQYSQGVEVSLYGQPLPGLNIGTGYSYIDAKIESAPFAGSRPRNVPKHTFNLWASYEVTEDFLQGLGGGLGVFYVSDRYGDDFNTWTMPGYTLVDATLWYTYPFDVLEQITNLRFQLSLKNLFDATYYPASGGDLRVSVGAPFRVLGSVSATF